MPQQDRRKGRSCFFRVVCRATSGKTPDRVSGDTCRRRPSAPGNSANDGMPKAGPDGPVRGNRSVGSGRYGWAGIRPAASRGTVGGRPVVGGSHTTGSCGCPAGNLQMLPRKVQRPGRCRRLFAETGIRYPRRGRTTPLPETNPAPSETLPAEAECRRQGWRTGGGRLSGASA